MNLNPTNAKSFLLPRGNLTSCKAVFVGDAPTYNDLRSNEQLAGASGRILQNALMSARLNPAEIYYTTVIKTIDKPIQAFWDSGKKQTLPESTPWIKALKEELLASNAKFVFAAGELALYALASRTGVYNWRGSVVESTLVPGKWIIPILHPSTILPPSPNPLNQYLLTFDLVQAAKWIEQGNYSPKPYEIILNPDFSETISLLRSLQTLKLFAFDIEVFNEEVSCISFAPSSELSVCIPFVASNGTHRWTESEELEIWLLITQALEDPRIEKLGQNLSFDAHFLLRKYGIAVSPIHDTMVAQQIIMPDFKKGLDFITSIHTDLPYHKDEGKQWFKTGGAWEALWHYNALDSLVCMIAFPSQQDDLARQQNLETYNRQRRIIEPLVFMQERGIKTDLEGIKREAQRLEREIETLQLELNALAGEPLNPNSTKQLQTYFYVKHKQQAYTKKGSVTTDNLALKRLARKGFREASLILRIRKNVKLISTYLELSKFDEDERFRCSYNPAGTRYSRISSSENIFGTGGNQQNKPHSIQYYSLCDDDYIGYAMDLSQAENRIVAYLGNVVQMIQAFENEQDVHSLTSAMIFGGTPESIKTEDDAKIKCSLGDGTHTKRFFGKKANHCKTADAEVLTTRGWVSIKQAQESNCALMIWDAGTLKFETPQNWFTGNFSGELIQQTGRYFSQQSTPEHRIPVVMRNFGKHFGKLKIFTAAELPLVSSYEFLTSGVKQTGVNPISSDELRLLIAFQADGTWNGRGLRWKLTKKSKQLRLRKLLTNLNLDYTEHGSTEKIFYVRTSNAFRDLTEQWFDHHKFWVWELVNLSPELIEVFCSEVVLWDGDGKSYWTTIRENAEIVQTLFHLNGAKASLGWACKATKTFRVGVSPKPTTRTDTCVKTVKHVLDVEIFCPTVSTGLFLVRENGIISVTGNSLNYGLGADNFSLQLEVPRKDGEFLSNRYHQVYPGVRNTFHRNVQMSLRQNRTLVNLLGRSTSFLGPLDDNTFKEAYSCIPQGTVGDIINEHGLNYIYYNQELFEPIELLAQIHDEIVFQIPAPWNTETPCSWLEHARMLKLIKQSLEIELTANNYKFTIPVDTTLFKRFKTGKDLKSKQLDCSISELAELLEKTWQEVELKTLKTEEEKEKLFLENNA